MTLPHNRESLLAAWDAIGPSQPLPNETHEILLAYFKHAGLHGEQTDRVLATLEQQPDQFYAPPARFVRQPRAIKKAPSGPAGAKAKPCTEVKSLCTLRNLSERAEPSPVKWILTTVHHGETESTADGPREDL